MLSVAYIVLGVQFDFLKLIVYKITYIMKNLFFIPSPLFHLIYHVFNESLRNTWKCIVFQSILWSTLIKLKFSWVILILLLSWLLLV